jgi:hypothetical protein
MLWSLAARAGIPAARSALRFLSKLKKPPGITVYRGQNVMHRKSLEEAQKQIPTVGRWFSDKPKLAMKFAGSGVHSWKPSFWPHMLKTGKTGYRKGIVEKMRLTKMEADIARRLEGQFGGFGTTSNNFEYLIVPKHTLSRVEKAPILTAIANLRKMMGIYKHGGLARILEV